MSLADAILTAALTGSNANAAEGHIVVGKDRYITVPEGLKKIGVQYDHNVETVTFDCPRYWDEHDMSKMRVYINYMRPDGEMGSHLCENVTVDSVDSTIMHFDWLISGHVTEFNGNITFLVCIKNLDSDGGEENHWNSETNTDLVVSQGLKCHETILRFYPDIIAQLLTRMDIVEDENEKWKIATYEELNNYLLKNEQAAENWRTSTYEEIDTRLSDSERAAENWRTSTYETLNDHLLENEKTAKSYMEAAAGSAEEASESSSNAAASADTAKTYMESASAEASNAADSAALAKEYAELAGSGATGELGIRLETIETDVESLKTVDILTTELGDWQSTTAGVTVGSVVQGQNKLVGANGKYIYNSTDGINWELVYTSEVNLGRHYIIFANGVFVDTVSTKHIGYSFDGVDWVFDSFENKGIPTSFDEMVDMPIVYGKGIFVCVGPFGVIYSEDGVNWSIASLPETVTGNLYSVIYNGGKFVATGKHFIYSEDGINWSEIPWPSSIKQSSDYSFKYLTYVNDAYICACDASKSITDDGGNDIGAASYILFSTDGINWTESIISSISDTSIKLPKHILYDSGKYIILCTNGLFYSYDGVNWNSMTYNDNPLVFTDVAYGNGLYVGVDSAKPRVGISEDGINWSIITIDYILYPINIVYYSGRFIVYGTVDPYIIYADFIRETCDTENMGLMLSDTNSRMDELDSNIKGLSNKFDNAVSELTDGLIFTETTIKQDLTWELATKKSKKISDIVYGDGIFVCVSEQLSYSYYSTDGKEWNYYNDKGVSGAAYSVEYGDGVFVKINTKTPYYSTDGQVWTAGTDISASGYYTGMAYGNGTFVITDSSYMNSGIFYSTDGGVNWSAATGWSGAIYEVVYGDGMFLANGDDGNMYTSTDGATWTLVNIPDVTSYIPSLAYANGKFIAQVGYYLYISTDKCVTWTISEKLPNSSTWFISGNGKILVATSYSNGTTLYSKDGITWTEGDGVDGKSTVIISDGEDFYIGTNEGGVYRSVHKKETESYLFAPALIRATLPAGETALTIDNDRLTDTSVLSFYTSIYGVSPIGAESNGSVLTLYFDAQETDMEVGVRVDG